jgi:hypothetical protein
LRCSLFDSMLPCIFQAYVPGAFVCVSHRTYITVRQSLFLLRWHTGLQATLVRLHPANLDLLEIDGNFGFTFCRAQHNSRQVSKINQGLKLFVRGGLFRLDNCAKALLLLVSQAESHVDGSHGGN